MHLKMIVAAMAGVVALAAVSGCGDNGGQKDGGATGQQSGGAQAVLPDDLFVDEAPAGARGVGEVKADADVTGEIVVTGRIGGRPKPFVEGAAVFVIADAKLAACSDRPGDSCPVPWDYCCEPQEERLANMATVRIVGEDGKPLSMSLAGKHGLDPLATVTVVGEIQPRSDTSVLVIDARRIHVDPSTAVAAGG